MLPRLRWLRPLKNPPIAPGEFRDEKSGQLSCPLNKYTAFLEKGWGQEKEKNSFLVKRSFSLPREQTALIRNSSFDKKQMKRGKYVGFYC